MQTAFESWIENADMPELVSGEWVDLETGLPFSAYSAPRWIPSEKAKAARDTAKFFGGKALQGSARQKEWAEKIRAQVLQSVTLEQAVMLCDPRGLAKHSKFWIENRDKAPAQFGTFIEQQKGMLKQYKTAHAAGDAAKVAEIAGRYNALTTEWGFN